ncbi:MULTISPECIES: GlyGly-CTERM sorting domain-containing protein [unclassified Vibrio]|nr:MULTISPECIES: GlyGly-CTERM sorting domain-containing protein [unclassified Vibrio]NNN43779.1 GlyGly-CTERM sorting domain-containing protein [Vibrio sp. 1-1(7)]NNN71603.1 GlyGly-CTERM sorting domain-containing protein [Vibrio sp. 12-2(3-a)]
MFERDQENKEVTTSSSGGSISWSLLGLGLLGWFRFRQGVKW